MTKQDEDLRKTLSSIAMTIKRLREQGISTSTCYTALTIILKIHERNITQGADKILSERDDDDDDDNFRIGDDEDLV